jgi:hypothetical protein
MSKPPPRRSYFKVAEPIRVREDQERRFTEMQARCACGHLVFVHADNAGRGQGTRRKIVKSQCLADGCACGSAENVRDSAYTQGVIHGRDDHRPGEHAAA